MAGSDANKIKITPVPGHELEFSGKPLTVGVVGDKKNYNLQPAYTQFELWSASTIEWVVSESKYKARVLLKYKTSKDIVAINSWHQDFHDAERAIAIVRDSMNGVASPCVYNIFGEILEIHWSVDHNVYEVQGLIWSMLPTCA